MNEYYKVIFEIDGYQMDGQLDTALPLPFFQHFLDCRDIVRIGVINCAQQSKCNDFNIDGTPTIRIFYPGMTAGTNLIKEFFSYAFPSLDIVSRGPFLYIGVLSCALICHLAD